MLAALAWSASVHPFLILGALASPYNVYFQFAIVHILPTRIFMEMLCSKTLDCSFFGDRDSASTRDCQYLRTRPKDRHKTIAPINTMKTRELDHSSGVWSIHTTADTMNSLYRPVSIKIFHLCPCQRSIPLNLNQRLVKKKFSTKTSQPPSTKESHSLTGNNVSKPTALISATRVVSQATQAATSAVTTAAATKASNTINKAADRVSESVRRSLTNAKITAKDTGQQLSRNVRRSMDNIGHQMKASAGKWAGDMTHKASSRISEATRSAKERLSQSIPQWPKFPKLSFMGKSSSSSDSFSSGALTKNAKQSLTSTSNASNVAAIVATKAASNTASRAMNQVQETIQKASRWLWWWGLAAVGVYGISTTLTKEGMQVLKEVLSSSKTSTTGNASGNHSSNSFAVGDTASGDIGTNEDNNSGLDSINPVGSSWISFLKGISWRDSQNK